MTRAKGRFETKDKARQRVKALILTGYGLNCDYETDYCLKLAGAESCRIHINEFIGNQKPGSKKLLKDYHILIIGGGFSWADDHGAGVLLASKLKYHLGEQIQQFIEDGKLIIGICNGFQTLVNLGLLPGFEYQYHDRRVALIYNNSGNFIDAWVNLKVNPKSPSVFIKDIGRGIQPLYGFCSGSVCPHGSRLAFLAKPDKNCPHKLY